MRQTVFKDFHALYPTRIVNKTNGITFRRWLFEANPGLTALISDTIGPAFKDDLERLRDLEPFADDPDFRERFAAVRRANKVALGRIVTDTPGRASIRTRCSTSTSSASTSTSGSCSTSSRRSRSTTRCGRTRMTGCRASRSSPARPRRAITGEAHHQARERRRAQVVNRDPVIA
jgi:hypothetical protein